MKNARRLILMLLVVATMVFGMMSANVVFAAETGNAAKIGDTEYATFAEAVKAVAKGAGETTITLLKNQTISGQMIGHQYVQNIVLDLNGYKLSANAITLTAYRSGTTLTVKNGTVSGNSTSGTLRATYGGKLILGENLTIQGAGGSATLVYVDNGTVEFAAERGVNYVGGKQNLKLSTNKNNKIIAAASIGEACDGRYYGSLSGAVAAAQDGETIVLLKDITMDNTVLTIDKNITIDFNGNTVTGKFGESTSNTEVNGSLVSAVTQFVLIENANVTLKDSVGTGGLDADAVEYGNLSNLIRVATTGKLTIESGNYHQNLSVVGAGMIDSRGDEIITVKGGTFTLGNVGTEKNGSPWILNTSGQNTKNIIVEGGTFNADIQHQYYPFEVVVPKERALKNENGKYTVVDAVAYVTEHEWSSAWYTNEVGYATLEEAFAACEGPKTKVVGKKTYTSEQEVVVLLSNLTLAENATIGISKSVVLDLNNKIISSTANPAILVEAAEVIIKNGSVSMTAFGTGTSAAPSVAVKVGAGAVLTICDADITATDADNGTVVGVLSEKTSELMLIRTSVLVSAKESLFNVGVRSYGVATLEECSIIAESDYTANAAGTNYASSSYGIASESDLTLLDCYVWGAHSGVRALGSVYVDGGTYEGYGHGAMYLAGAGTTSYLYNAAFNWAEMRSGTFADSVAGTNNAAFYIGGASNIIAYFDGCSFKSNNVKPSYCIVLRSSSGESNNSAYVSNSTFSNYNHSAYRVSNTENTINLYAYSGVGNQYLGSGRVFNYANKGFYTEESYAQSTGDQ